VILVDTNVLAEPLRPVPQSSVIAWLDRQPKASLYLCAPVLMEVMVGIAFLPDGKRKRGLAIATQALLENHFADRFLVFDREAAVTYALLASRSAARGVVISVADAQVAAIAAIHGFAVATRDSRPFEAAGIPVINPWKSQA
jgi:toxin FitB